MLAAVNASTVGGILKQHVWSLIIELYPKLAILTAAEAQSCSCGGGVVLR